MCRRSHVYMNLITSLIVACGDVISIVSWGSVFLCPLQMSSYYFIESLAVCLDEKADMPVDLVK